MRICGQGKGTRVHLKLHLSQNVEFEIVRGTYSLKGK